MQHRGDDALWNGEKGAGGISWAERSRMGPLRGVIDAADEAGRRNLYMHTLHSRVLSRELTRVSAVRRALDFGCGTGRFLKILSQRCAEVYATDKELCMIEAAREYAGGFVKRIEQWRDGEPLFESQSFDFVLCSSVLCVTTAGLFDISLREIARVLKRGGTLLLLEQVAPARELTLSRYSSALSKAGLEVVRSYPFRRASSAFTSIVTNRRWIPKACFGLLASVEVISTFHRSNNAAACAYVEYAIVARRR